ncbi:hypothetical protein [Actinosynnema sp. NPDC023587]|uniref:hypothetical protein n=1 Tax=Actinosynnema sp. NPDC023587 TaxID=3154695 RepID=UPI003411D010
MTREVHNELSGTAHAAAQARTVHGGVHFHQERGPSRIAWSVHSLLVAALLVALTMGNLPPGTPDAGHQDRDHRGADTARLEPAPSERPPSARVVRASDHYRVELPEPVEVFPLPDYRCGGTFYSRVILGFADVPATETTLVGTARAFLDKWLHLSWGEEAVTDYAPPTETARTTADGEHRYYGIHLRADVTAPAAGPCASSTGVVHALVLDAGDTHRVLILVAGLDGDPHHADVPTTEALETLLADIRPAR